MISSDDLFHLTEALSDRDICRRLKEALVEIWATSSYQNWLGSVAEAEPFRLPRSVDLTLLEETRLAKVGRLAVKVNRMGQSTTITDGVWVDPQIRVFPFRDESEALVGFARKSGLVDWADIVMDLATGCGHNFITLDLPSFAFDINPRALTYAAANRTLNAFRKPSVLALNDVRNGIPSTLVSGPAERVLILANMPFGPAPNPTALPLTSNGGESGAELQIATFQALADLRRSVDRRFSFRACLMGLTIGSRDRNRWEVVERAMDFFGSSRVRWHLLSDEHVFRVDGVRRFANPAPIMVALPGLASCRLYTPDCDERAAKIAAFQDLAMRHQAMGNSDIAYGIIEVSSEV